MPTFPRRSFPGPAADADALSLAPIKDVRAERVAIVTQTFPQNKRDLLVSFACAAFVISLLLCLRPFADVPRNDDFSYARTAESLAVTGRIAYNGWGSPIILPQALYGALLIRAFGFSRDVLDASGIAAAGLCAFLLYLLSRASRIAPAEALVAVGVLVLNAPFLAVAPSFMNDLPSLALLLAALLLLVRSLPDECDSNNGATSAPPRYGLFAVAVALGVVAGASRQNNWAAVAGALVALAWLRRDQQRAAGLAAAALVAGAGLVLRWFGNQPYTVPVDIAEGLGVLLTPRYLPNWMMYVYRLLNMMGLFLLPVALFALRPARDLRRPGFWIALILCAVPLVWPLGLEYDSPLALHGSFYGLSEYGKYFTSRGVLVGGMHGMNDQPFVLPVALGHALKGAGAVGLAITAYLAISRLRRRMAPFAAQLVFWSTLAQFTVSFPFFAASHISDRYILFFLPGLSLVLLTQRRDGSAEDAAAEGGATLACIVAAMACLGFMAVTGWAIAASYMNYTRAQAVLYRRMEARGYARREIDGGADWNLDTQVVEGVRVNNPAMTPASAFRKNAQGAYIEPMAIWYPALDARIVFSLNRNVSLPFAVESKPVDSETWTSVLPPARRTIYALKVQR